MIRYTVRLADLNRHHFEVLCHIENPVAEQRFSLPSWIPGSYLLREFARHIVSIRAESDGREIDVEKVSKGTWCCRGANSSLSVTIEVYALDRSVRGAYLDGQRGYFNGTCLFLCPEGLDQQPVEVLLETPCDPRCESWRVATAMVAKDVDQSGFGLYRAENYDELIDHPVEMSDFSDAAFKVAGVPHLLVIAGRHRTDLERIASDLTQLCETHVDLFGRPPPFDSYCFLGLAVGEGYGGLEHRASSSLIFSRDDLPKLGQLDIPLDYQRFLSLCSHEYFHTWNVKRIKPKAFTPYLLDRRAHTRLMWVFEGITSYYQDLMLLRSDLIGLDAYLSRLGQMLTRVYRSPGRLKQSISDSSFDAWDRLYKPEANSTNATISYYSKGALVALALDLTLRKDSKATLDQVIGELWKRFGEAGIGLEEDEFETLCQEISGLDLTSFFDLAVRGTKDLPLAELLTAFGVSFEFRQAKGPNDASGLPSSKSEPSLDLGVRFRRHPAGLELMAVVDGGPAERAGMNPGDVVIAIGGLRIVESNLAKRLVRLESGETVAMTAFRGDELMEFSVMLVEGDRNTCVLETVQKPKTAVLERRKAWLGS